MRRAWVIAVLLVFMIVLAGCGKPIPRGSSGNTTPVWGQKPREYNASGGPDTTDHGTPVAGPTAEVTSGPVLTATIIPMTTTTASPAGTYRNPPPEANITANYTVIYDENLIFSWNATALAYKLEDPPLIIDYTLTVPNITRISTDKDPVSGGDITVTKTYPDPQAYFEITVRDPVTMRIFAQGGYARQYDVSYTKQLRILYPGNYHIQMAGNKVTAHVKFTVPGDNPV
jgi:hypothetical protein